MDAAKRSASQPDAGDARKAVAADTVELGSLAAENDQCLEWARDGECIRNPQYMFASCAVACNSLRYVDADKDCGGWAENGECEKNPGFMFAQCNASCITLARRSIMQPQQSAHPNPHLATGLLEQQPVGFGSSRAHTFLPIFVVILALLVGGFVAATRFAPLIAEKQEAFDDLLARTTSKISRSHPRLAPLVQGITANKVGTCLICLYYANEAFTVVQTHPTLARLLPFLGHGSDGVWQQHSTPLDLMNLLGGAAAMLAMAGVRPLACSGVMVADTIVDSYVLVERIFFQWLMGRGLYINELMAKKFSLLGCVGLVMATTVHREETSRNTSFSGMLLEGSKISERVSLALLAGRLLIAFLFLYVGFSELHRLLFQPFTPYLPGDGHDVVWPKAVELILSLPFVVGVRTTAVSRLLAASLLLEALYAWSWWRIPGDADTFSHHRRAIHYREHFVTNVATAGGLLLLQKIGAGRYTVDELLKKQD